MGAYFEHVTGPGERWDLIAWRYYRDVRRQPDLVAANRNLFVDAGGERHFGTPPAVLPAGVTIRVPVIEIAPDESNLPPWKRGRSAA